MLASAMNDFRCPAAWHGDRAAGPRLLWRGRAMGAVPRPTPRSPFGRACTLTAGGSPAAPAGDGADILPISQLETTRTSRRTRLSPRGGPASSSCTKLSAPVWMRPQQQSAVRFLEVDFRPCFSASRNPPSPGGIRSGDLHDFETRLARPGFEQKRGAANVHSGSATALRPMNPPLPLWD